VLSVVTLRVVLGINEQKLLEEMSRLPSRMSMEMSELVLRSTEAFRNAFQDVLDTSIEQLDRKLQARVAEVEIAFCELMEKVHAVADRAQVISNILPFASKLPYVNSVSPRSITTSSISAGEHVLIDIRGNFPYMPSSAQLTFLGSSASLVGSQTTLLQFSISPQNLFPFSFSHSVVVGTLTLRSPSTCCHTLFADRVTHFKVPIGRIPPVAGKIIVFQSQTTPTRGPIENKVTQWFEQHSGIKSIDITERYSVQASSGHKILSVHVDIDYTWLSGVPNIRVIEHTEELYTIEVYTCKIAHHRGNGPTKKIRFRMRYEEYKETPTSVIVEESSFELKWGESRALEQELTSGKIVFHPFDGSLPRIFITSAGHDPFILIRSESGRTVISARNPQDILFKHIFDAYAPLPESLKEPDFYSKNVVAGAFFLGFVLAKGGIPVAKTVIHYIKSKL
jgi:hypothetical protein